MLSLDPQFISQMTYTAVIVLICLIASGFYFLSPLKKIKHNIYSERYLSLHFLMSSIAFAIFSFSLNHVTSLTVLSSNVLFVLSFAYLKFAFISRHSEGMVYLFKDKLSIGLLVVSVCLNQYLLFNLDESHLARMLVLNTAISIIILSTFSHVALDKNHPSFGEKLVILGLKISLFLLCFVFLALSVTSSHYNFLSVLTIILSVNIILTFGSTLTMFLSEISDMYHKQSSLDFLTGLQNRRQFYESSNTIFNLAKRQKFEVSIIMGDIDDFKFINDTFGHDVGDQVIVNFASIIKQASRNADITARIGGEEFCLVLPYTGPKGATELAERIRQKVAEQVLPTHICDVRYTASFGVSTFDMSKPLNSTIIQADRALYQAKDQGKNKVAVFNKEMALTNPE